MPARFIPCDFLPCSKPSAILRFTLSVQNIIARVDMLRIFDHLHHSLRYTSSNILPLC